VPDRSRKDQLDGELNICIMDALGELFKRAAALGQGLAQRYGLSMTDLAGLHKLEEPMTMKELGQRLHCDPSFVTMVANSLEKHGLAQRETSEQDRRIKVMRLTDEGTSMRERLEKEFSTRMPWATALSDGERECLLTMLRRLVAAANRAGTGPDCMSPDDEIAMTGGDTATN
jgi:MarR family transcriptional regulator, organic hydroperoxide resistance regulator